VSGYREHNSFDPNAYQRRGAPLRPFNWVQWTGVGIMIAGALLVAAYMLGRFEVIPLITDDIAPFVMLMPVGSVLIGSRREGVQDPAPELAAARKRWLLIVVALCTAILGAAVAIQFSKGA
jgi:hypothetical protein